MIIKAPKISYILTTLLLLSLVSCVGKDNFSNIGNVQPVKDIEVEPGSTGGDAGGTTSGTSGSASASTSGTTAGTTGGVNHLAPVANNFSIQTDYDTEVQFEIDSSKVSDPVDAFTSLIITVSALSTTHSISVNPVPNMPNRYSYRPIGFRGGDSINFTVTNTKGLSASGVITVSVESVFYNLQPALAVRASGCIMCHAKINSTVITDFGYEKINPPYFFYGGVGNLTRFQGSIYGDYQSAVGANWATAVIQGDVFVPKMPDNVPGLDKNLAQYLRVELALVTKPKPLVNVIEKSSIYIGAPTKDRILGTVPPLGTNKWTYVKQSDSPNYLDLSGLISKISGTETYLTNDTADDVEFKCDGDLVIDSVLFLKNLRLRTSASGCRIYSTRTVFIQGAITYLGENSTSSNLQIVSSRGIMLGLGLANGGVKHVDGIPSSEAPNTTNSVKFRLVDKPQSPSYFTRTGLQVSGQSLTESSRESIVADSNLIPELLDAQEGPNSVELNRTVSFNNLLLVAPHIQSRYIGGFTGVIIAEVAIASLSKFDYAFAPVFSRTPILPLIKESDFLRVEE